MKVFWMALLALWVVLCLFVSFEHVTAPTRVISAVGLNVCGDLLGGLVVHANGSIEFIEDPAKLLAEADPLPSGHKGGFKLPCPSGPLPGTQNPTRFTVPP